MKKPLCYRPSAAMSRALVLLNKPSHEAFRANVSRLYSETLSLTSPTPKSLFRL